MPTKSAKAKPRAKPTKRAPGKAAPKKAPAKKTTTKKTAPKKKTNTPVKFGRAGTAGKGDGKAVVREYIAGLRPDQRAVAKRVDALIAREVPDVRRAVKWSMPFYGREGQGWFCAFAAFKQHYAVRFFRGTDLKPPPAEGNSELMRGYRFRDASELDEKQLASWVRQAAALPGWGS